MANGHSGDPGKNRGRPPSGEERTHRQTRATEQVARGETPGVVSTIRKAQRYEQMYAEYLGGGDVESIALRHDLSPARVAEVLDQLRADNSWLPEVKTRWYSHRLADDLLLRRRAAVDEAADLLERAVATGNIANEIGARKYRDDALTRLEIMMKDIGLLPKDLAVLTWETESRGIIEKIFDVFDKRGIPREIENEIAALIEVEARSGDPGTGI